MVAMTEDYVPFVELYVKGPLIIDNTKSANSDTRLVNKELVDRGAAIWVEAMSEEKVVMAV